MFRRRFLKLAALSGAFSLGHLDAAAAANARTVHYLVRGFSCPTCAVGLDATLRERAGVLSSASTYPEGRVTVSFDADRVTEREIRECIASMGFTVSELGGAKA